MKIVLYAVIVLSVPFVLSNNSKAQTNTFPSTGSAGIGTITPNASSILEMKSTTQGILIPRMTSAQRIAIASPATGLMVFQTNGAVGFYYYSGTAWTAVSSKGANTSLSNLKSPTAVNVDLLPDSIRMRNLGSFLYSWKNIYLDSSLYLSGARFLAVKTGTGANNTAVGASVLNANTTGANNTGVGYNTLLASTTGSFNTAVGSQAMSAATASYNTGIGDYALSNSQGINNTAVGFSSMIYNSTGFNNTSVGQDAMHENTLGDDNTSVGNESLAANTEGAKNVAVGSFAMNSNVDGTANTAIGDDALFSSVSGFSNAAFGTEALHFNTASQNTAFGFSSLYNTTTGGNNTALGYSAGSNVKTGSGNIFIGYNTNCGTTGAITNSTAIGNSVTITTSNNFIFGNDAVTGWGFAVGPGTRAIKVGSSASNGNGAYLTVGGTWTNASARWKKEDFQKQDKNLILEKINQLDVTKWKYKGTINEYHYGPMADDFYRLFAVGDDSSISDMDKTGVLFLGMQQLIKMNDEKDKEINDLQKQVDELKAMIVSGNENIPSRQSTMSDESSVISGASLQQNIPNPFTHTTTINYSLPQQYSSAKIIVVDELGRTTKSINLSGSGRGSINLSSPFRAGASYQYSLYIDGKLISTKQMEHIN